MKRRPILIVLIPAVAVATMFSLSASALHRSSEQRRSSCAATQVALDGVRKNALAGIRPVPPVSQIARLPIELQPSFREQRDATIAENQRRREVIAEMLVASARLAASDFCSNADGAHPWWDWR